jgi:2-polyprenyl-3-methyl-5-hydroxy-6-metoxy-1,4-benzoquinol methylase
MRCVPWVESGQSPPYLEAERENQMRAEEHWDEVYRTKQSTDVSWYQPSPEPSIRALDRFGVGRTASFIDVGGGASSLVDALLERGWSSVTVLDIAAPALQVARERLGDLAQRVSWEVADITDWVPPRTYDTWHDRAAFHFLTSPEARHGYKRALEEGTRPGSVIIMATFALEGPEKCSGLVVQRYSPETLSQELGSSFEMLDSWQENHTTPNGSEQAFNWCVFKRNA